MASGSSKTEAETVQLASTVAETIAATTEESSVSYSQSEDRSDSDSSENSTESDESEDDGNSTSDLPVWLTDGINFGGYCSPDSDSYTDEEEERKARLYRRNLHFSDGFLVEEGTGPPRNRPGGIYAIKLKSLDDEHSPVKGKTQLQYAQDMCRLSLRKYNALSETNVRSDHVVRVTGPSSPCSWTTSYITFMAKESEEDDDTLVEYQAKVAKKSGRKTIYPIFCRPSPKLDPDM